MKTSPQGRVVLLLAVILLLIVAAWDKMNPPNSAAGKTKPLTVAEAKRKEEASLAELKRLVKEQETFEPDLKRLAYKRPSEEIVPRLVRDLQRIAKQAKVRLLEVKPQRPRPTPSGKLEKTPIEVRFRAPFQPNVVHFLYLAEAPEGKMTVEKFNITAADARQKTVDVSAMITVFTSALSDANRGEIQNVSAKTP